jgi:hypothetical protein
MLVTRRHKPGSDPETFATSALGPVMPICCRSRSACAEATGEPSEVLNWFRDLSQPPEETLTERGVVLYFKHMGPLALREDGSADGARSPVVNLVLPIVRWRVLWTTGAVHFLTMPVSQFPELAKIRKSFGRWIESQSLAYSPNRNVENPFAYFLMGGAPNRGVLYGLPSAMAALSRGQYFVDETDNDFVLDRVRRTLRLRGVDCAPE